LSNATRPAWRRTSKPSARNWPAGNEPRHRWRDAAVAIFQVHAPPPPGGAAIRRVPWVFIIDEERLRASHGKTASGPSEGSHRKSAGRPAWAAGSGSLRLRWEPEAGHTNADIPVGSGWGPRSGLVSRQTPRR
jgi:hypothetical protein